MSQTIGTVLVIPVPGKSAYQSYVDTTEDDPVLTEEEWSASNAGGEASVTNAAVASAIAAGKGAIWTSLGVPSYANLTAANVALSIGQTFYNTTSGKLEIATA